MKMLVMHTYNPRTQKLRWEGCWWLQGEANLVVTIKDTVLNKETKQTKVESLYAAGSAINICSSMVLLAGCHSQTSIATLSLTKLIFLCLLSLYNAFCLFLHIIEGITLH